jgi:hypothetical protein
MSHRAQMLEVAEPGRADVAVLPFSLEACVAFPALTAVAVGVTAEARESGAAGAGVSPGGFELASLGAGCVVLSRDLHRERLSPTDVPLPTWTEDPVVTIDLAERGWAARPVVNFVGQAYPLGAGFVSRRHAWLKWTNAAVRAGLTATPWADRLKVPGRAWRLGSPCSRSSKIAPIGRPEAKASKAFGPLLGHALNRRALESPITRT